MFRTVVTKQTSRQKTCKNLKNATEKFDTHENRTWLLELREHCRNRFTIPVG